MNPSRVVGTALVALSLFVGCSDEAKGPTELSSTPSLTRSTPNGASNFVAPLDGSQEVPAVTTHGTGVAKFQLSLDGAALGYKLIVANIKDVTQSHIHLAARGSNGPVVAFLFGFVSGGVTHNGVLAQGSISAGDLVGPLAGMSLTALLDELRSGDAYVNVHTVAHPPGEIRGQILAGGPDS